MIKLSGEGQEQFSRRMSKMLETAKGNKQYPCIWLGVAVELIYQGWILEEVIEHPLDEMGVEGTLKAYLFSFHPGLPKCHYKAYKVACSAPVAVSEGIRSRLKKVKIGKITERDIDSLYLGYPIKERFVGNK